MKLCVVLIMIKLSRLAIADRDYKKLLFYPKSHKLRTTVVVTNISIIYIQYILSKKCSAMFGVSLMLEELCMVAISKFILSKITIIKQLGPSIIIILKTSVLIKSSVVNLILCDRNTTHDQHFVGTATTQTIIQ